MLTMIKHSTCRKTRLSRIVIVSDVIVARVTALFDRQYRTDSVFDNRVPRSRWLRRGLPSQARSSNWHFFYENSTGRHVQVERSKLSQRFWDGLHLSCVAFLLYFLRVCAFCFLVSICKDFLLNCYYLTSIFLFLFSPYTTLAICIIIQVFHGP